MHELQMESQMKKMLLLTLLATLSHFTKDLANMLLLDILYEVTYGVASVRHVHLEFLSGFEKACQRFSGKVHSTSSSAFFDKKIVFI